MISFFSNLFGANGSSNKREFNSSKSLYDNFVNMCSLPFNKPRSKATQQLAGVLKLCSTETKTASGESNHTVNQSRRFALLELASCATENWLQERSSVSTRVSLIESFKKQLKHQQKTVVTNTTSLFRQQQNNKFSIEIPTLAHAYTSDEKNTFTRTAAALYQRNKEKLTNLQSDLFIYLTGKKSQLNPPSVTMSEAKTFADLIARKNAHTEHYDTPHYLQRAYLRMQALLYPHETNNLQMIANMYQLIEDKEINKRTSLNDKQKKEFSAVLKRFSLKVKPSSLLTPQETVNFGNICNSLNNGATISETELKQLDNILTKFAPLKLSADLTQNTSPLARLSAFIFMPFLNFAANWDCLDCMVDSLNASLDLVRVF